METDNINGIHGDTIYRIIIVGSHGVGKTSLVTTFVGKEKNREDPQNDYNDDKQLYSTKLYRAKICLSCSHASSEFHIVNIEAQIIDELFEQDLFDNFTGKNQVKRADGCLCVFDLSQKDTFQACTEIRNYILRNKVRLLYQLHYFAIREYNK